MDDGQLLGRAPQRAELMVIEHPLARLRRLLEGAGLHCERLSPIEADGEHVLAAFARPLAEGPVLTTHAEGAA